MSKKKIFKILGIILLVVIAIFLIHTIRNYIIITDLQNKIDNYSNSINYYTNPQIVLDVPKDCFLPSPKVDSAVIKLDVLKEPKVKVLDEELFFKIVKFAFLQKRKTLINSISSSGLVDKMFLEKMLNDLKIDVRVRAEQLTLEQFGLISDYIKTNI